MVEKESAWRPMKAIGNKVNCTEGAREGGLGHRPYEMRCKFPTVFGVAYGYAAIIIMYPTP